MSRIAYVNGAYLRHATAGVSIEDRGFQLADSVYEVCEVRDGAIVDFPRHMARLDRSLGELRIERPASDAALLRIAREVVRRNLVRNGIVYMQVSRGAAPRDHGFPLKPVAPTLVMTARPLQRHKGTALAARGVAVITLPDNRWHRVDIKTTGLLPNVLAKQAARESGAYEAVFVDDNGYITEGASTNMWMVTKEGTLVTRQANNGILQGVTRDVLLSGLSDEGMIVVERPFSVEEALNAKELFLTAASTLVMPVVKLDGKPIGDGQPGQLAARLRDEFHKHTLMIKV